MNGEPAWLARFLRPGHAAHNYASIDWQGIGEADTPGADARCRIHLACERGRIVTAAFAAYGPPVVVACADWVCARARGRTIDSARGLTVSGIEHDLVLVAQQRYAALLALDALANALRNLKQ